jgi:uroporphyrinogen-III decarboxylase
MAMTTSLLPIGLVFNPRWWCLNYGISFDVDFFFNADIRIESERLMEKALYERYGEYGFGLELDKPIPVAGSRHIAGGFLVPALFGCEVRFSEDAAPWVVPANMTDEQVKQLKVPDIASSWPFKQLIQLLDKLEEKFGYVLGDFNTGGILNVALDLRGQQLYLDFYQQPDLVHRLFRVISETIVRIAQYVHSRTGSTSISVNRMISHFDTSIFLHGNCAVTQISPSTYENFLLPCEKSLSAQLQPYGIHHCGDNLQNYLTPYSQVPLMFLDVGWGSDIALIRSGFPNTFLNLRLSPVRMLQVNQEELVQDVESLISVAGPLDHTGMCCINIDYGTPEDNIKAFIQQVKAHRNPC